MRDKAQRVDKRTYWLALVGSMCRSALQDVPGKNRGACQVNAPGIAILTAHPNIANTAYSSFSPVCTSSNYIPL
jgi:hypothetical protein